MDNITEKNDTGENTISQEPEWPAGLNSDGLPLPDPRLVEKLVEELKSQGKFDQIRNDCFAEVDTQPAYQNLRSRVTETVQRFLGRQRWNPSLNKNQLRNQLKQHIQQTPFMEDGVERIVEQVVNPKIMSVIQPEVENLICSWFDVERPDGSSKTGPGLRGDISPLTPERDIKPKQHYSESVYAKIPPKGQTGFMPPAPNDNLQGRSTTPEIKVKNETVNEKSEKDNSLKAKDYTVKDFLSGNATSPRPTAVTIKKSTEFEDLLKKSEMIKSAKKESDEAKRKREKEKEILRKNKEKEKEIMRRKKEKDILRRQKEIDTTTKGRETHPKHAKDELRKEKDKHINESKKHAKEKESSCKPSEKINNKDTISRTDNVIDKDDGPDLFCVCRKEDDGTFMIGCDECEEWYHPRCINLSRERVEELENEEWACPQCENKKGNVSPLTPPPLTVRPVSPRTPPLPPDFNKTEEFLQEAHAPNIPLPPPPGEEELQLQEEVIPMYSNSGRICKNESEMSPVSDTELSDAKSNKNISQGKSKSPFDSTPSNLPLNEPPLPPELEARIECTPPPPPPDKSFSKPPSPLTSPIGSSPDDMEEPIRESITGYSSQSVMASDLRTPRQMQSQYKRAAVSDPAVTYNQGDTQSSVSASDISDTDLPDASGNTMSEDNEQENLAIKDNDPEDDLEALEKAKAELQARLAATNIGDDLDEPMEDSDGEVHTDDSNDYMKRFREIASGGKLQTKAEDSPERVGRALDTGNPRAESSMSPISSEGPTPEPTKEKQDIEEPTGDKDDHAAEKIQYRKKDDPDDDDGKETSLSLFGKASENSQISSVKSSTVAENQKGTSTSEKSSAKSESPKERHHSNSSRRKHRHSSSKDVDKHKRSSHSSSSHSSSTKKDKKSSRHKSHDKHRYSHPSSSHTQDKTKERRHSSSKTEHDEGDDSSKRPEKHDRKADKETKKEMEKKREKKLKTVEEKVNQTYKLKSDKYEAIDMFAPKQTKYPSIANLKTLNNGCTTALAITAGTRIQTTPSSKAPSDNPNAASASLPNFIAKDKDSPKRKEQEKANTLSSLGNSESVINFERKKVDRIKEQIKKEREHNVASSSPKSLTKGDSDTSDKSRKIFPELPVSKCDGDKIEQHKDDYVATKRRLEEARARKMADIHRKKEMDKVRRKSHSGTLSNSSSGEKLNITLSPSMMNTKNELVNAEMEIKLMEESRRKEKKKENKDKKKRDKDKIDRDRNREHHDSDNNSNEAFMTPTKQAVKRKFSSRESDDSSSSDNEWKKCGLKESEQITLKREPRKRKPTKKYSSSEYNTDESWEETEAFEQQAMQSVSNSKGFCDSQLEAEVRKSAEMIMATDLEIQPFEGFADVTIDTEAHNMYQKHISNAVHELETDTGNNESDISDSCLPENFYNHHDYIYLSELNGKTVIPNEWRGAKKVAALLKKNFGGNPTVVRPIPRWLKLKLDRWGLRRHEINLICESSKLKNSRIYKEEDIDRQYPNNQDDKNRCKRLRLMVDESPIQMPHTKNMLTSSNPANIKRRRDTVEKNLDEMFSSDQENDLDINDLNKKKARIDNEDKELKDNVPASSPILEPFYGFQENETNKCQHMNNANNDQSNLKTVSASIEHLKPSLIQVDSNGNTFGMSSVFASPISDFSSDYEDDEILEASIMGNLQCKEADTRLPMSVGMNYSMVQYLRHALQNEEDAIKELNRILGMPNSTNTGAKKEDKLPQVDADTDKLNQSNSFVKRKLRQKEKAGEDPFCLYSEDDESSIISSTNVSSIGLHVLPPSPISCSDSLSSHEGAKNMLD